MRSSSNPSTKKQKYQNVNPKFILQKQKSGGWEYSSMLGIAMHASSMPVRKWHTRGGGEEARLVGYNLKFIQSLPSR